MSRRRRYPTEALLLYVALGVALGMVLWALFVHDSGGTGSSALKAHPAGQVKTR